MPSKKQRSKQRRRPDSWPTIIKTDGPNVIVNGVELTPSQVVAAIARGGRDETYSAAYMQTNNHEAEMSYRQQLYYEGLVQVLLGFLGQCDGPLSSIKFKTNGNNNEPVTSTPFHWVNILNCMTIEMPDKDSLAKCRVHVSKNLSPLIKCMCDTDKRELFQSNSDWHGALDAFVRIVGNVIQTEESLQYLICHEGLIGLLIQSMFFLQYRPDILSESSMDKDAFSKIAENAECIIRNLFQKTGKMVNGGVTYSGDGLTFVKAVASAPIVNSSANSGCAIPFVIELARRLNSGKWDGLSSVLVAIIHAANEVSLKV